MSAIFQQSASVLGTDCQLTIVVRDMPTAEKLFRQLWKSIHDFDRRFSRFRPDSELTKLNQHAGTSIMVSTEFGDLLTETLRMSRLTDGLFNPFVLPALQRAGYGASWMQTQYTRDWPDYRDRQIVKASSLELDQTTALIPARSAIDLGGIGKGYLLRQLGGLLENSGVDSYWLALGGDILVAGTPPHEPHWRVDVADALSSSSTIAHIATNQKLAIATSGITKRRGNDWHHIIDPMTGVPAHTDILTATVCMPDPVEADVYASCMVALGTSGCKAFAKTHIIMDSLLQVAQGTSSKIEIQGSRIRL